MKFLIIRFSSFGDAVQCLGVPTVIKREFPNATIHWVIKKEFAGLIKHHIHIDKVWQYEKATKLRGLIKLALELRKQSYTHIYDAHNNLRSKILNQILRSKHFTQFPKQRWKRLLLFRLRINRFPKPYVAQLNYLKPLKKWCKDITLPSPPQMFFPETATAEIKSKLPENFYVLITQTAWPMKSWPMSHFEKLIELMKDSNFVLLGGPQDKMLCEKLVTSPQVINLAGQLSWEENAAVISLCKAVICADTGFLQVADQLGKRVLALIGPTAFGYPARSTSQVLEIDLNCRPCSKDGSGMCKNKIYQACMIGIKPETVSQALKESSY